MRSLALPLAIGALAPVAALTPSAARAQLVAADVRFGMTPTIHQDEIVEFGPVVGIGLTVPVAPRLRARADVSVAGIGGSFLDVTSETYTLGLEVQLAATRGRVPLRLGATLGAGASRIDRANWNVPLRLDEASPAGGASPRALTPASTAATDGAGPWHPTFTGGLRLTVDVARRVGLFADAGATVTPIGGRRQGGGRVEEGGTYLQLPVAAGVRVRF